MRILVDTSVWIDFFNGISNGPRAALHNLLQNEQEVCISDYILSETLQGFRSDKEFETVKEHLLYFPILGMTSPKAYIEAARLYRTCRKRGITIRKTVDCLIAAAAVENDVPLLHNDTDFDRIASLSDLKIFPV